MNNNATAATAALCMGCYKGSLPTNLLCDRSERTRETPPAGPAYVKGTCLRCCNHNHG